MIKLLDWLKKENKGDFIGVVLDLCNNFGGVLQAAVDVSDVFVDDGLVVYIKGRLFDFDMKFYVVFGDLFNGILLVVLVNGGLVLAFEIVVGVFQDYKWVVIMGIIIFGKGLV